MRNSISDGQSPHARRALTGRLRSFGLALLASCAATSPTPASPPAFSAPFLPESAGPLAVVGDLQRTSAWEFWREQNDQERALVVAHVAAGRPSAVLLLGDMVIDGSSQREWQAFDELVKPLRELDVPCLAAIGNHELWGGGRSNLRHFFPRFPLMGPEAWISTRWRSIGIIVLDSNRDRMSDQDWQRQMAWLETTLEALDADASVRTVVVAVHHPALTNGTVTGNEPVTRDQIVPALAASRKTALVLAGHVHAYEHFVRGGRHFVVSGGGGGPRAALDTSGTARHADDLVRMPPLRPFHVLWLQPLEDGLEVQVDGLDKCRDSFSSIDRFAIAWPT